jgi:hypothetical protein
MDVCRGASATAATTTAFTSCSTGSATDARVGSVTPITTHMQQLYELPRYSPCR